MRTRASGARTAVAPALVAAVAVVVAGCTAPGSPATGATVPGTIAAVGAENQYADVISQIGGRWVTVTAIMSNPGTDPHSFEASASVARAVSRAGLVVQNGLGYDSFVNRVEFASPNRARKVIDVQDLLRLPDDTPDPHLWYDPGTMPAVARAIGADLSMLQPAHAAYFRARTRAFLGALRPWTAAIAHLAASFPHFRAATTEPVGDYLLRAAGADDLTPFGLQADIMNGVDPAPQYVAAQDQLLSGARVDVLVYNEQVTDPVTDGFLATARRHHIPVVGVYETMPAPGFSYQSWMLAEVHALDEALAHRTSTERL